MKHLKLFNTDADYQAFISGEIDLPNVSFAVDTEKVYYNPFIEEPILYKNQYLTFEAIEDSTFKLTQNYCQYSLDEGETWVSLSSNTNTPTVPAGSKIMFKKENPSISSSYGIGTFSSTGKFNVSGNVMSMLYGEAFVDKYNLAGKMYTFMYLFSGCTNVVEAHNLILPATTLAASCYREMFSDCTSLTTAPELPATTLVDDCYRSMFYGCSKLTTSPSILPATTLAKNCYYSMFVDCTSLVTAPKLLATTLAMQCYYQMFSNCTSLVTAPELPATTLATYCYANMFLGCTSLVNAPELPATTLAIYCYQNMFSGCTSLVNAPELPATELIGYCYNNMFYNCTSLNKIVMLATNISASDCLYNWVSGVASTGTFVKHKDRDSLPIGISGIPSGWEVKNHITPTECTNLTITANDVIGNDTTTTIHYTAICNGVDYKGNTVTGIIEEGIAVSAEFPKNTSETETVERTITFEFMGVTSSTVITQGVWVDYEKQYLTFEAIEDSTFRLTRNACEYSMDEGETWVSLSADTKTPTVPAGNKILFKATNPTISSNSGIGTFKSSGKFNVSGNVMSMLYGDDFEGQTDLSGKDYAFYRLFLSEEYAEVEVVNASNLILPATTLAASCYTRMFYGCSSLVKAPRLLPATILTSECYYYMFKGCTSLTTAPELPATTLAFNCYSDMFDGCTSLTKAPELPATELTDGCYKNMFSGCTSLVNAPELPATKLISFCYSGMFYGCTSLNKIVMLATNIYATNCLNEWVSGVASTGTFVKHPDKTNLPTGSSGIPSGWTVQDASL